MSIIDTGKYVRNAAAKQSGHRRNHCAQFAGFKPFSIRNHSKIEILVSKQAELSYSGHSQRIRRTAIQISVCNTLDYCL